MSYKIPCKQFIYGKLVGVQESRYELIAKSLEVTETDAFDVYKEFNGYRPSSTAIAAFQNTYVIKRLKSGEVALLCLTSSNEKNEGRNFLQEHYIILNSFDVTNSKVKMWLWLLGFPLTPPFFTNFSELSSFILLSKKEIQEKTNQAIKLLTTNDEFQYSIITTLHHILRAQSIAVTLNKSIASNWIWLTTLSLLIPNYKLTEIELYQGQSLPHQIKTDLGIIDETTRNHSIKYIDFTGQPRDSEILNQAKNSYTNLSWRCLETDDLELFRDLMDSIESIDFQALPSTPTTPLDVLLWASSLPKIGLPLARKELSKARLSIDELHWLWRNSLESFSKNDINVFLPILIEQTVSNWTSADYLSLQKLINRTPNALVNMVINEASLRTLLNKWTTYPSSFTQAESYTYISLLERMAKTDVSYCLTQLLIWIQKAEIDDVFNLTVRIVKLIPRVFYTDKYYWDLILPITRMVRNQGDLLILRNILESTTQDKFRQPLIKFAEFCSTQNANPSYREECTMILTELLNTITEDVKYHEIIHALFIATTNAKLEEALISLSIAISRIDDSTIKTPPLVNNLKSHISDNNDWIMASSNNALIGSFLYIVRKLSSDKRAKAKLTELLLKKPDEFPSIIKFMQEHLQAQRNDLSISLEFLSDLPEIEQLNMLIKYVLFTENLPLLAEELEKLKYLIVRVNTLDSLDTSFQNWLLSIFRSRENWYICQRILEHQIRSAIKRGRIDQSLLKLHALEKCIFEMKVKHTKTSKLITNSIWDYFNALSVEQKEKFLNWLINAPFSESPPIEHKFSYFLTSSILENKTDWFVTNPIVRLSLFNRAIQIYDRKQRNPR